MSQSQHQFDRALSEGCLRIYAGHANTGSANARGCDCARCGKAIPVREGTPIDWNVSGIVRARRRYICADCTQAIKETEHGEATTN
jgi:DNA-directed RNA polymerase subunit RPC12/RpoP